MQNEIYDDEEIEIVIHGRNVDPPLRPSRSGYALELQQESASYSFMSEDVEFIPFSKPSLAKFNWFVKACIVISTVCLLIIGANLLFSGDITTSSRGLSRLKPDGDGGWRYSSSSDESQCTSLPARNLQKLKFGDQVKADVQDGEKKEKLYNVVGIFEAGSERNGGKQTINAINLERDGRTVHWSLAQICISEIIPL